MTPKEWGDLIAGDYIISIAKRPKMFMVIAAGDRVPGKARTLFICRVESMPRSFSGSPFGTSTCEQYEVFKLIPRDTLRASVSAEPVVDNGNKKRFFGLFGGRR